MMFFKSVTRQMHSHIKFHLSKLGKESIVAMFGMLIEYHNIFLYGYLASIIIPQFFYQASPLIILSAILLSYVMGPIGAVICGHVGDTLGRKRILAWALAFVSITSFLISILPTYDQIGITASILFIILRSIQTLGFGGDAVGLVTFILEDTPTKHRGLFGGFMSLASAVGVVIASLFVSLLDPLQNPASPWRWRLPLSLGVVGLFISLFFYRQLGETEAFKYYKQKQQLISWPLFELLKQHRLIFFKSIGIFALAPIITIIIFGFIPYLGVSYLGLSSKISMWSNTVALILFAIFAPIFGAISDKIGRRPILFGVSLTFLILSFPLFEILEHKSTHLFFFIQLFLAWVSSAYYGVAMTTCIENLPTGLRYTGVAVSFYLSAALFGGINGLYIVNILMQDIKMVISPVFYLLTGSFIVLLSTFFIKESIHKTLEKND